MARIDGDRLSRAEGDLLAWLLLAFSPPSAETAKQLAGVDLAGLLEQAGLAVPGPLPRIPGDGDTWVEAHATEYVRLFVNSRETPVAYPEGAAYLQDEGPEALARYLETVREALAGAGIRLEEGSPVPADHLTVLLEYLYWNAVRGISPAPREAGLLGWIPRFVQRLREAGPPPFYEQAADLLVGVLDGRRSRTPVPEPESMSDAPTSLPPGQPDTFSRSVFQSLADGILVLDLERKIRYVNRILAGYYGKAAEELIGRDCSEVIGFDHCRSCPHADVVGGGEAYTGHSLHCDRFSSGPFCVSASPLLDDDGKTVGMVEIYRDMRALGAYIEDIETKNEELDRERRQIDEILAGTTDGYYTAAPDRTIRRVDEKLLELIGLPRDQVVGRGCHEVFGSDKCDTDCPIRWAVEHETNVISCREQIHGVDGVLPVDKSVFLQRDDTDSVSEVVGVLRNASEIVELRRSSRNAHRHWDMVSRNRHMEEVFNLVSTFGPTDETVLILGESGTGKELVANALQAESPRRERPFLKVNCSALTEELLTSELFGHEKGAFTGADRHRIGRFEAADGGTLFLDEVGDMSPALQTKVLRVLEQREFERVGSTRTQRVDVRILAATNRNLKRAMGEGKFREDLYYRLNTIQITMPPLRNRPEDVPLLVRQFMAELNDTYGRGIERISARALDLLTAYPWPGNIRELRNAVNFAYVCATGERIERQDLPESIRDHTAGEGSTPTPLALPEDEEKRRILEALHRWNGNRALAAEALGISRTTLWRKLKTWQEG